MAVLILASGGALDTAVEGLLAEPTALTLAVLIVIFLFMWKRDISNPEKNASNAILTGAMAHSSSVYEMANVAVGASLRCEKRNLALVAYVRTLQAAMSAAGINVPPMPDDIFED